MGDIKIPVQIFGRNTEKKTNFEKKVQLAKRTNMLTNTRDLIKN